jgi:WhiB family transcriptional regulator, redox-sensing transcriptional regulator
LDQVTVSAAPSREDRPAEVCSTRRVEEAQPMYELMDVDDGGALSWQERALCAQTDPEAFFPEKGGSTREAKKVCLACDVRGECLEYALAHDERFGIWGGLSERERRKLKKRAV